MNLGMKAAAAFLMAFLMATPALAQFVYTDEHGSFYTLTIGADTDASAGTETRELSLVIDTSGNDNLARYLDAAAIKVSGSFISSSLDLGSSTGGYSYVGGGTNASGCSGSGGGFMCASGHTQIGGTFTFVWDVVMAAGALFDGVSEEISLKSVYNAGLRGNQGFYQVSVPMTPAIPEPSTYALMFAGLAAVGFMARRRRPDQG